MGCQAVRGRKEFLERVGRIRDIGKGWKRRNVRKVIATGKDVIYVDQGEEGTSEEPTGDGMSGRVRQEWISGKVRVSEKCQ